LRVFVTVKVASDHYPGAWAAPENIVRPALAALPPEAGVNEAEAPLARVIAVARTDSKTRIVFDVFHDNYNPETGHLKSEGNLPVWVVTLSKKNNKDVVSVFAASDTTQHLVNQEVRRAHGSNARNALPPFREDFANGNTPIHINPRCLDGISDQ
jgi:hypothetical protein